MIALRVLSVRWLSIWFVAVLVVAACASDPRAVPTAQDEAQQLEEPSVTSGAQPLEEPSVTSAEQPPEAPSALDGGGWLEVPPSPLSPRTQATVAWTGSEILVVGGSEFSCPPGAGCPAPTTGAFADGAAYDPIKAAWRTIAEPPVAILWAEAATLGNDVFFLASTGYSAAAPVLLRYDSLSDQWQIIDLPADASAGGIVATDTALVVYGTTKVPGSPVDVAFDPVAEAWEEIPDDPLGPAFDRQFVWNGQDLYLFDHALVPSPGGADGPSFIRAARLHDGHWEALPSSDSIGSGPWLVDGSRLISPRLGCADGGQTSPYGRCIPNGAVFDTENDTWSELPNTPDSDEKIVFSSGGVSSEDLVLTSAGHPTFNAIVNEWFDLPTLDEGRGYTERRVTAVGRYGFVFGGASFGSDTEAGELLGDAWILHIG